MLAGTINDLSAKNLFYFILFHIIYIYIYFLVGGVIVCTYIHNYSYKLSVRLELYFCSFFPPAPFLSDIFYIL